MKKVTLRDVFTWKPCDAYTQGVMELLFDKREFLDPFDVACLPIEPVDRLWVLLHLMDDSERLSFMQKCEREANELWKKLQDDTSIEVSMGTAEAINKFLDKMLQEQIPTSFKDAENASRVPVWIKSLMVQSASYQSVADVSTVNLWDQQLEVAVDWAIQVLL